MQRSNYSNGSGVNSQVANPQANGNFQNQQGGHAGQGQKLNNSGNGYSQSADGPSRGNGAGHGPGPNRMASNAPTSAGGDRRKPVHSLRLGRISAAIWMNESEQGTRYNVSIVRSYKDGEAWKDTQSFGRDDLLLVAKIADMAHTWIFSQSHEATPQG